MFNERQLLGLSSSAHLIAATENLFVRHALATNFSDLLRYQNMLCRYDTMALKSLDIFSVHGLAISIVQCGIQPPRNFLRQRGKHRERRLVQYHREVLQGEKLLRRAPSKPVWRKETSRVVYCRDEWIGEHRRTLHEDRSREVSLHCQDSASQELPAKSLDAVLTDPPYFGNVQCAELIDFCYDWLRKLLGHGESRSFARLALAIRRS